MENTHMAVALKVPMTKRIPACAVVFMTSRRSALHAIYYGTNWHLFRGLTSQRTQGRAPSGREGKGQKGKARREDWQNTKQVSTLGNQMPLGSSF